MKTFLRIAASLAALLVIVAAIAYAVGAALPVDHSVSVTGVVPAPPEKVFALITGIPAQPTWRRGLQSVEVLPAIDGKDHWRENLGHGQFMTFTATRTAAPTLREVLLDVPGAPYGGTWTYELSPAAGTATTLTITETGFIHPPLYRFMMAHVFGPTYNLSRYLTDIQTAAAKP